MIDADRIASAKSAIDDMDDYARMDTGLNPIGARTYLETFVADVEAMVVAAEHEKRIEGNLSKALKSLPAFVQRQDGTMDQLRDLERVAVKLGMYDAADLLRGMVSRHDEQAKKIEEKARARDEQA